MQPNAQMSLRASVSAPSICSGAMYWNVPRIVPWAVIAAGVVGNAVASVPSSGAPSDSAGSPPIAAGLNVGPTFVLASPKSSSFAPLLVSITLPGFRSRWTMPARWA